MTGFGRRELLAAAAILVPLIGCAHAVAGPDLAGRLAELERNYGARLGVAVLGAEPTAVIAYRADEHFAFCSTFKAPLVAAVLQSNPPTYLQTLINYTSADIRSTSPITEEHVQTGMTIGQLCDAAIRYSDGTAANLLLADLGGTAAFTGYLRGLGDTVSRLDQTEPELNDPRDAPSFRPRPSALWLSSPTNNLVEVRKMDLKEIEEARQSCSAPKARRYKSGSNQSIFRRLSPAHGSHPESVRRASARVSAGREHAVP